MSYSQKTITVQRYRDSNGNPTCCGHTNEDVCPLLVWSRFGFGARCRQLGPRIKRRSDSCYSLIPLPNCPVWKDDGRYDPEHCIVPVQSRLEIKEAAPGGNAMIYQWIKVGDRLPPIGEVVWLYENGSIYTGGRADCEDGWLWGMCYPDAWWLDDDGWTGEIMTDSRYKPTHWMPKPMPPEREGTIAESEIAREEGKP